MKIIATDNFAREHISERLIADNIKSENEAEIMLKSLRDTVTNDSPWWYELKEDDYVLYKFEP